MGQTGGSKISFSASAHFAAHASGKSLGGGGYAGDFLPELAEPSHDKTYCDRGAQGKQESQEDRHGNVINTQDFRSWRRLREARKIEALFADEHANVVREQWLEQSGDVETGAQRIAQQCQHKDDIALNSGE